MQEFTERYGDGFGIVFKVKKILFEGKSEFQEIKVLETPSHGKVLVLDGCVIFTERDEFIYHEMITHIPLLSHPDPKKVLIIGGGDGGAVREVLKHPSVEEITLVEINEGIVNISKEYFPDVSCELGNAKVSIVIEDGYKFIKEFGNSGKSQFDVVIVDLTDFVGPAKRLFSESFYFRVKNFVLNYPLGIIATHAGSPFHNIALIKEIYQNIKFSFCVRPYLAHIPTYPGGWSFIMGSYSCHFGILVENLEKARGLGTKYFNVDICSSILTINPLPTFLKKELWT